MDLENKSNTPVGMQDTAEKAAVTYRELTERSRECSVNISFQLPARFSGGRFLVLPFHRLILS